MTGDSGARLRGLYAADGGTGEIFSAKTADYVASRPDYPADLFDALHRLCALRGGATVVDVGAGTGLLTRSLLDAGYAVTAVEPNASMRAAADSLLRRHPHYRSIAGTAEAMPIDDASVDLITAAQAFHWFDVDRARAEFLRVLQPAGKVALIWNDRLAGDPLHAALDALFGEYGGDRRGALVAHEERHDVPRFFGRGAFTEYAWPHSHRVDAEGLSSLVFSRSYMPARHLPEGQRAGERLRQLFAQFAEGEELTVRYRTVAIIGRPA